MTIYVYLFVCFDNQVSADSLLHVTVQFIVYVSIDTHYIVCFFLSHIVRSLKLFTITAQT